MFQIIRLQGNDIQQADHPFNLVQLVLNEVNVFSTEEVNKLENIARKTNDNADWLVDADRNSQELGELNQLRIKLEGQTITFEVQEMANHEFEACGAVSIKEFKQTLSQAA